MKASKIILVLLGINYIALFILSMIKAPSELRQKNGMLNTLYNSSFDTAEIIRLEDRAMVEIGDANDNVIKTNVSSVHSSSQDFFTIDYNTNTINFQSENGKSEISFKNKDILKLKQVRASDKSKITISNNDCQRLEIYLDNSQAFILDNHHIKYLKINMMYGSGVLLENCIIDTLVLHNSDSILDKKNTKIGVVIH
jgi:hypothetical protein